MLNQTNPELFKAILCDVVKELKNGEMPKCEQVPIAEIIDELDVVIYK